MLIRYPAQEPSIGKNSEGWLDYSNKMILDFYIYVSKKNKKKINVLELGSYKGLSANYICSLLGEEDRLYCVDIWTGGYTITKNMTKKQKKELKNSMMNQFIKNTWENRHKIIITKGDGVEELIKFHSENFDFDIIYLDMDHEYEPVLMHLKYITGLYPKSIIIGDDFLFHQGVSKAVYKITNYSSKYLPLIYKNVFVLDPHYNNCNVFNNIVFANDMIAYESIKKPTLIILYNTGYITTRTKFFIDKIKKKFDGFIHVNYLEKNTFNHSILLNHGVLLNSVIDFFYSSYKIKRVVFYDCSYVIRDEDTLSNYIFYDSRNIILLGGNDRKNKSSCFMIDIKVFNSRKFPCYLFRDRDKNDNLSLPDEDISYYLSLYISLIQFSTFEIVPHNVLRIGDNHKTRHAQNIKFNFMSIKDLSIVSYYYKVIKEGRTSIVFDYVFSYFGGDILKSSLIYNYYTLKNVAQADNIGRIAGLRSRMFNSEPYRNYLYFTKEEKINEKIYFMLLKKFKIEITFFHIFKNILFGDKDLGVGNKVKKVLYLNNHLFDRSETDYLVRTLYSVFRLKPLDVNFIQEYGNITEHFNKKYDLCIWYSWDFLEPQVNYKKITHYLRDLKKCLQNGILKIGGFLLIHIFNIYDNEEELSLLQDIMKCFSVVKLCKYSYPLGYKKIFYVVCKHFNGCDSNERDSIDICDFLEDCLEFHEKIFFFEYKFQNLFWKANIPEKLRNRIYDDIIKRIELSLRIQHLF
jgi:predicted O-methyltransferase YrrM